ncbi:MAG: PepSY domain-containing protein [Gemmatimonadetes bacterium]|nr:PepSY domain-containing protein [Gemmatimonadota bacterium]
MRNALVLGTVAALAVGATAAWKIQRDHDRHQDALSTRAAISLAQAEATALAAHPGARIVESEIEDENGRLIYSFELEVDSQSGEVDVEVDAMTGELLPADAEDDDDEGEDRGAQAAAQDVRAQR